MLFDDYYGIFFHLWPTSFATLRITMRFKINRPIFWLALHAIKGLIFVKTIVLTQRLLTFYWFHFWHLQYRYSFSPLRTCDTVSTASNTCLLLIWLSLFFGAVNAHYVPFFFINSLNLLFSVDIPSADNTLDQILHDVNVDRNTRYTYSSSFDHLKSVLLTNPISTAKTPLFKVNHQILIRIDWPRV